MADANTGNQESSQQSAPAGTPNSGVANTAIPIQKGQTDQASPNKPSPAPSEGSAQASSGQEEQQSAASQMNISDFELDALKEVANIGSGNASIALSSVFNRKVNISIPDLQIINISSMSDFLSQEGMVVGIFSRIKEGMDGNVFIFFPTTCAINFVSVLKKEDRVNKDVLTKEDEELLKKMSNVIYSAYITGIANFFEHRIIFSQPDIMSTIGTTILDSILARLDKKENLLTINITFDVEGVEIKGDFLLVLTMTSLSPLLDKLKQKMGG